MAWGYSCPSFKKTNWKLFVFMRTIEDKILCCDNRRINSCQRLKHKLVDLVWYIKSYLFKILKNKTRRLYWRWSFIPCKDMYDIIYITGSHVTQKKTTMYINGKTLILRKKTSGSLQCGKSMHDGKIEHDYFDVKLAF